MSGRNATKWFALTALTLLGAGILCGCSPKDTSAPTKTAAEIDAEIKKVQDDTTMPPQAKTAVLTNLQKAKDAVAKSGSK